MKRYPLRNGCIMLMLVLVLALSPPCTLHAQKSQGLALTSCAGDRTCGGHPGSRGHEYQDALTYAQWGVDYLKYDWCNTAGLNAAGAYTTMRDALAAPLIAGNDIRTMSKETAEILTNREVIAIDQDSLGVQGFRYNDDAGGLEVWAKPLSHNDWALCFLNRTAGNRRIDIDWPQYAMSDDLSKMAFNSTTTVYTIRDLWKAQDLGTTQRTLRADIPPRDVLMLRLTMQRRNP